MGGLLNLPSVSPGISVDGQGFDTGRVNKSDSELDTPDEQGQAIKVKGQRADQGDETFVEIKAPTFRGTESSVPYSEVLPEYKKEAEKAINRRGVPKGHEERVRRYFESLTESGS